ncbi:MAG: UPF0175 family protein [Hormoscilla sp. GM102CHS1]|nr:UPF0175 family protein [Hormoscilla sp. GM102CHS1]
MIVTIEIPDRIAQGLDQPSSRRLLEIAVAEAYRSDLISTAEVGRMLQLPSRLETHAFLKQMGVYLNYDEAELEQDIQTMKELRYQ